MRIMYSHNKEKKNALRVLRRQPCLFWCPSLWQWQPLLVGRAAVTSQQTRSGTFRNPRQHCLLRPFVKRLAAVCGVFIMFLYIFFYVHETYRKNFEPQLACVFCGQTCCAKNLPCVVNAPLNLHRIFREKSAIITQVNMVLLPWHKDTTSLTLNKSWKANAAFY